MSDESTPERESRSLSARFGRASIFGKAAIVLGALASVFVVALIIATLVGILAGKSEDVAALVSVVRDLFIILLAMQGMLVCIALIVGILQVAVLVNSVRNEFTPVAENLKKTSQTVRGTGEFLSENLTESIVESKAWFAGAKTLIQELHGLRKAVNPPSSKKDQLEPPAEAEAGQTPESDKAGKQDGEAQDGD